MKEKQTMSSEEIILQYKEGRRDFSNIYATMVDFTGISLKGAIFRDSNLSFSFFKNTDLTDADFTNANLEWSSFESAVMKRTKFVNANVSWSKFNKAHFEKTSMQKADMSWSIFFDTNFAEVDTTSANMYKIALNPSDITEEGLKEANAHIASMRSSVPFDVWINIRFSVNNTASKFSTLKNIENLELDSEYNTGKVGVYGSKQKNIDVDSDNPVYGFSSTYKSDNIYKTKRHYKK